MLRKIRQGTSHMTEEPCYRLHLGLPPLFRCEFGSCSAQLRLQ